MSIKRKRNRDEEMDSRKEETVATKAKKKLKTL
jgi:hypothetical protein